MPTLVFHCFGFFQLSVTWCPQARGPCSPHARRCDDAAFYVRVRTDILYMPSLFQGSLWHTRGGSEANVDLTSLASRLPEIHRIVGLLLLFDSSPGLRQIVIHQHLKSLQVQVTPRFL